MTLVCYLGKRLPKTPLVYHLISPRMKKTPPLSWILSFGLSSTAPVTAQIAPAPSATVVLNPFVVNTDKVRGYPAVDSHVGFRIATELMETPSDATELTQEFLRDIGATSYREAGPYLADAVVPDRTQRSAATGDGIRFRGAAGGSSARYYFRNATDLLIPINARSDGTAASYRVPPGKRSSLTKSFIF